MVNRIPGSKLYGSTSSAANRSRTPSSSGASGKGSLSTHSTVSSRTTSTHTHEDSSESGSRKNVNVNGARAMNRGSFRRTLMFQNSKRNGRNTTSNNDTNKRTPAAKTNNPECLSPSSVANRLSKSRSTTLFKNNRNFLRSPFGGDNTASALEEREAGADSPTFPLTKSANVTFPVSTAASQQHSRKEERNQREEIPRGHVNTILRFYGGTDNSPCSLDLYRDVLRVSPEASDREIRIAYFRRGREILGDNVNRTNQNHAVTKAEATKLDPFTKSRFQAVSMAYEILSTPAWREIYLRQGGLTLCDYYTGDHNGIPQNKTVTPMSVIGEKLGSSKNDPFSSSPSTVAAAFPNTVGGGEKIQLHRDHGTPKNLAASIHNSEGRGNQINRSPRLRTALRKSSFLGRGHSGKSLASSTRPHKERSSSSVRWKDHVEELVFAKHPNEHASDDDSSSDSDDSDYNPNDENTSRRGNKIPQEVLSSNSYQRDQTLDGSMRSDPLSISFPGTASSRNAQDAKTNDSSRSSNSGSSRSRRRKKNKPKIVIDSEELESHLKRMDNEAEKHFVKDFWDNFEESMDGILSLVDSIGGGGGGGDSSKGTANKSQMTFSNPSSWLSPKPSFNSSSVSQQRSTDRAAIIGRSLSHDLTISSKSTEQDNGNNEVPMKRSNSFPSRKSSTSALEAVSPTTPSKNIGRVGSTTESIVTPDEKRATSTKKASNARAISPYEMIMNAWPFQSDDVQQQQQEGEQQTTYSTVTSPIVVSPSPTSTSRKMSMKNKVELLPHLTESDTTLSVASTIISTSQQRQKFFRPISPEASEVHTSNSVSVPSKSCSKHTEGSCNTEMNMEMDDFELESRLSEMKSVDLTLLDNPFRHGAASPTPAGKANGCVRRSSSMHSEVSNATNDDNATTNDRKMKKSRFRVSMMSTIRGSSSEKDVSSIHKTDKDGVDKGPTKSDQSIEDVFAGVEEDSQNLQQYDLAEGNEVKVKDISIERSASRMSDLSGSMFSSRTEIDDDNKAMTHDIVAGTPSTSDHPPDPCDPSLSTRSSSVTSSPTKKSQSNDSAVRSQASTNYSSCASSTLDDSNGHSLEAPGVEASGFFEYFTAYVTAVMTECANVGTTAGVAEYHKDFIGFFSNENNCHATELRDQPSSVRRVASESNRNSLNTGEKL
mmetsp:Transcript_16113/g.37361  ORF Transcript_16113/g.37361 Transcript_16113/m.37361 type:complete len:1165 (+) Transcript_16113:456-3950(+)